MARIVKEQDYTARRDQILDVAQRLVQTRGYEQMTVQAILDDLKVSKGAFFHYFDSKQALLEALTQRMLAEVERILQPLVDDPELSALEKMQRYFALLVRWKGDRKALVLEMARVWVSEDNAVVRQKVHAAGIRRTAPLLATIIRQGIAEGVFATDYPDQAGVIVLSLVEDFSESLVGLLLAPGPSVRQLPHLETTLKAYNDALGRVLGAPWGSLEIIDAATLAEWAHYLVDGA